ncbi:MULTISPECIES: hypothetical protein [Acinetobacter]|uniref:hypothetical protein n=1 Tax=Acinetobacter TaxID=469 RepID=UPI0015D3620A|nr:MULTISPECIES: hypothetical protein [Acinetobacter]
MSAPNDLYWNNQNKQMLAAKYKEHLQKSGLENTFDNCYDFICRNYGSTVPKKEFGVSTSMALAKAISGQQPNDYSF